MSDQHHSRQDSLTSAVPELRGIGLYDDVPTWPHAHQHSRPPLLLAGEAVEWETFKNDVDAVTALLGCNELAQRWRWSVLSWLGSEQSWDAESPGLRFGVSRKVQEVRRDLQAADRDERLLNRFFFSGRVPPLQQLLLGLPLSNTATRSEALHSCLLWFPRMASNYVLQIAEAVHTKVVPNHYTPEQMIEGYWDILDKLVVRYGEMVGNVCQEVSGKIAPNWSSLTRNQKNCSIAIFKTLSNLLYDVQSSRTIHHDLLYLWIPNKNQAWRTIQAVRDKELGDFVDFDHVTTSPSSPHHHSSSHVVSPGQHLHYSATTISHHVHHLPSSTSHSNSLCRPSISSRMRNMYGI